MTNQINGNVVVNGTHPKVSYAPLLRHAVQNKGIFAEHRLKNTDLTWYFVISHSQYQILKSQTLKNADSKSRNLHQNQRHHQFSST